MKRIAGLSILIIVFLFSVPVSAQEAGGPRIEIKELQHDFGKVIQGMQATHVFEVRNAGTEPLIMERVQSS
jgi:hypothetical protein